MSNQASFFSFLFLHNNNRMDFIGWFGIIDERDGFSQTGIWGQQLIEKKNVTK